MPVFKNIDGTLKPSFRIGTRGVIIEPEAAFEYDEKTGKVKRDSNGDPIKNEKFQSLSVTKVGTQDKYYINRTVIRNIEQFEENGVKITRFYFYDDRDPIEVGTSIYGGGGVPIMGDTPHEEEVVVFNDATSIKTSKKTITENIDLNSHNEGIADGTKIPTVSAIVNYIGAKEVPLTNRLFGDLNDGRK